MNQIIPSILILIVFAFCSCQKAQDESTNSLILNSVGIQTFEILTTERSIVSGIEGTTLIFEPNSFIDKVGNIYNGSVKIHLKEFRSLPNMLLEGLTTSSNGKMLETQGMIFISATKPDSSELKLRKNVNFDICFQIQKAQEEYELFYGEKIEKEINWQPAKSNSLGNSSDSFQARFTQADTTAHIDCMDRLMFSSSKLGWINCDRFIKIQNLSSLSLNGNYSNNTIARLIFYNYRSILPAFNKDGKILFENLPTNERVHLVVYKSENNKLYFFDKEIRVDNKQEELQVKLVEVSAKDFIKKIRNIENAVIQ